MLIFFVIEGHVYKRKLWNSKEVAKKHYESEIL